MVIQGARALLTQARPAPECTSQHVSNPGLTTNLVRLGRKKCSYRRLRSQINLRKIQSATLVKEQSRFVLGVGGLLTFTVHDL